MAFRGRAGRHGKAWAQGLGLLVAAALALCLTWDPAGRRRQTSSPRIGSQAFAALAASPSQGGPWRLYAASGSSAGDVQTPVRMPNADSPPVVNLNAGGFGDKKEAPPMPTKAKELKARFLGAGKGSFLLEMGGQRLLINPNLEDSDLVPETVHEHVDRVIITSSDPELFHWPTISRMKLNKLRVTAVKKCEEKLLALMPKALDTMNVGPGAIMMIPGDNSKSHVCIMVAPGTSIVPWESPEAAFIFINMDTGVALGYEGMGQYCGENAGSFKSGIPEEAYLIDYLVTPKLREATGVCEGLTKKGCKLRGVVHLPVANAEESTEEGTGNPLWDGLIGFDRAVDKALGGVEEDPKEFEAFLRKQKNALKKTRFIELTKEAGTVDLES